MNIHKGDLVTVRGRYETHNYNIDVSDCQIVSIVPAAQAPRSQTNGPQMGGVPQAPTGATQSSPPAGYYQCYNLQVVYSANYCERGDLQLDGQGNYSSTNGPGGQYFFDPGTSVVSFSGGMMNGRMAFAMISNKGTYMLRMRLDGRLPSSLTQPFGNYTFEHNRSGHRERL